MFNVGRGLVKWDRWFLGDALHCPHLNDYISGTTGFYINNTIVTNTTLVHVMQLINVQSGITIINSTPSTSNTWFAMEHICLCDFRSEFN